MAILSNSSNSYTLSLKVLLISTGVLSMAMALKLSVPLISQFVASEVPLMYSFVISCLRPPYLYLVINFIIITIVASSKLQSKIDESPEPVSVKISSDLRMDFAVPTVYDAVVSKVEVKPEFVYGYDAGAMKVEVVEPEVGYGDVRARVSEVKTPKVTNGSEMTNGVDEFVISRSSWTPPPRQDSIDFSRLGEIPPMRQDSIDFSRLDEIPPMRQDSIDFSRLGEMPPMRQDSIDFSRLGEMPPMRQDSIDFSRLGEMPPMRQDSIDFSRLGEMPPMRQDSIDFSRLGEMPPMRQDSIDFSRMGEKPPVSARFGHRKAVKGSPEAGKALRVSKPKRQDTLESTWKTITEGRPMPLTRHLRKSDTWETTHSRHNNNNNQQQQDHLTPQKMKKSETFNDHSSTSNNSSLTPSPGSGKLRKEPSLSQDDLNRRVEAFIKKFNEEMRMQRQESLNQYHEMIKRGGAHH